MNSKHSEQLEYYQRLAREYDLKFRRENPNHLYKISQIAHAFFEHLAPRNDGFDFLEVGAGTGIHAFHFLGGFKDRVRSFVLSDLSPAMLDQAKVRLRGHANVDYLASPGESLATERMFDGIYVSGAMHHFSSPAKSITEMRAHLKPGGVLVICEPNVWNPVNFIKAAIQREEWGQFSVTRPNIRALLRENALTLRTDRVLHWKGRALAQRLWPYERLELLPTFDPVAVMFLLAAQRIE